MFTGTIVLKHKDKAIPTELLEKLLAKHKSCSGVAVALKDEHKADTMLVQSAAEQTTIEALTEIQETFADDCVLFYFGNSTGGKFQSGDVQPFTAIGTKENPEVVVLLAGKFELTAEEDKTYSPAFFAFHTFLKTKLEMAYKLAGKDMKKFLGKLRDKSFNDEINELCGDDGQVTILAKTGDVITFSDKNTNLRAADWGWTSQHPDAGVASAAPEKPAESKMEKAKALMTGVKRKLTSDAPKPTETPPEKEKPVEAKPPAKEQTVVPLKDPEKEKPSTETAIKEPVAQGKIVQCPAEITGHKNIRRWYKKNAGFNPPNYKIRPAVVSKVASALSEIELAEGAEDHEFHAGVGDVSAAASGGVKRKLANPQEEEYLPEGVHRVPKAEDKKVSGQFPQIVPPQELEGIKEFLKQPDIVQSLDTSSNEIDDPTKLQGQETKWPALSKQTGQQNMVSLLDHMSFEAKVKFAKAYPVAFVKYSSENCVAKFHLTSALKSKSTTTVEAKPSAPPVKQAVVDAPKPAQTSGSGVKRKLAAA